MQARPLQTVQTLLVGVLFLTALPVDAQLKKKDPTSTRLRSKTTATAHLERQGELGAAQALTPLEQRLTAPSHVERSGYVSVQVNVALDGSNILGDAANEPSIVVDPTAPNRMAIGWRQFATVLSDFRQAGVAYSNDGGRTWLNNGALDPTVFRSDPVLTADADGRFYYYSLQGTLVCDLFFSANGGRNWSPPIPATGGDKAWTSIDTTGGIGHGNYYAAWSIAGGCCEDRVFTRSTDGGSTFLTPIRLEGSPIWGTTAIGPDGTLYIVGNNAGENRSVFVLLRSENAQDPAAFPTFEATYFDLGGWQTAASAPNPVGLVGQVWMDVDKSDGPRNGHIYVVSSINPFGPDPQDVHFVRSEDGGRTFTPPVKVTDDSRRAWQWFATMSVAPNGRIDVVWIESLSAAPANVGEIYYAASHDGGDTWSTAVPITPSFDSHVGWPIQQKIGDYFHMVSDNLGADLSYSATFNGEQDVYYVRIGERDCNRNGAPDSLELEMNLVGDCNSNQIPDTCEVAAATLSDDNHDGIVDECQTVSKYPPRRNLGRH